MLDLVNFAFTPAAMFYLLGYSQFLDVCFLIFFLLCGALRQGDPDGGAVNDYFTGLPIPYGIITLAVGWIFQKITGIPFIFTPFLILTGLLFILRFPFKKQKGIFYIIWPAVDFISIGLVWIFL